MLRNKEGKNQMNVWSLFEQSMGFNDVSLE